VPTRGGDAWLPAFGRASLPGLATWDTAEVVRHAGRLTLRAGGAEVRVPIRPELPVPGWRPARRLRFGPRGGAGTVLLDDLGFHRVLPVDPAHAGPPLDAEAAERWARLLDDAWPVLCAADPQCASDVRSLLRSVEPVPASSPFLAESATSGDGVGAVAGSDPGNAVELAATLTHEAQHSKLGMLMHLYRLVDQETEDRFYAPWRHDPRPLRGMLQGIYAFMGVARFWRGHRLGDLSGASDPHAGLAAFEFALWRRQLAVALAGLGDQPELRPLGRRFVELLGDVVDGWQEERLPAAAQVAADRVAADHSVRWRLHHLAPHPELVAALAGDPSRVDEVALFAGRGPALEPDPRVPSLNVWWSLTRSGLGARTGPGPDENSVDGPRGEADRLARGRSRIPDVRPADLVLLRGDVDRATALYAAEITRARAEGRGPRASAGAWAGLRLTLETGRGPVDAARALWFQPELVAAVYAAVLD
ncbi:HEXXH motif-containing putative peptide modification protein, partial [Streptomyces sp. SID3343]|uniref:aKG-HExxH-type peptide beta-hydroxylase n=1 Tax=Streptomyces sp. SID3343 TaxID=2690260 RepID=UPI0013715420